MRHITRPIRILPTSIALVAVSAGNLTTAVWVSPNACLMAMTASVVRAFAPSTSLLRGWITSSLVAVSSRSLMSMSLSCIRVSTSASSPSFSLIDVLNCAVCSALLPLKTMRSSPFAVLRIFSTLLPRSLRPGSCFTWLNISAYDHPFCGLLVCVCV